MIKKLRVLFFLLISPYSFVQNVSQDIIYEDRADAASTGSNVGKATYFIDKSSTLAPDKFNGFEARVQTVQLYVYIQVRLPLPTMSRLFFKQRHDCKEVC